MKDFLKQNLDWDRWVPLGMDGKKTRNRLLLALGAAAGWSVQTPFQTHYAVGELYMWQQGKRVLQIGARMPVFSRLLLPGLLGYAAVAAAMALVVLAMYLYHYQDGRSIYTMRRLADPWELWRRCLTLPLWTILACGVTAVVLSGLYYLFYLLITPVGCLP